MRKWSLELGVIAVFAGWASGCTSGDVGDGDDHGFVKVRLFALSDPRTFDGTVRVDVSLEYGQCLSDFYAGSGVALQQSGLEGEPIFARWQSELCAVDLDAPAECEAIAIAQDLEPGPGTLRLEYEVTDLGDTQQLAVGPIPRQSLTGCPPVMELAPALVSGFGATGEKLWETLTFEPAEAEVDQGESIQIRADLVED